MDNYIEVQADDPISGMLSGEFASKPLTQEPVLNLIECIEEINGQVISALSMLQKTSIDDDAVSLSALLQHTLETQGSMIAEIKELAA